jgi:peptide subunit release factor 1 (eRF1)
MITNSTKDTEIQTLKIQRSLKELSAVSGDGTSLISVMIAAGGSIPKTRQKLLNEEGTATQIKSRV